MSTGGYDGPGGQSSNPHAPAYRPAVAPTPEQGDALSRSEPPAGPLLPGERAGTEPPGPPRSQPGSPVTGTGWPSSAGAGSVWAVVTPPGSSAQRPDSVGGAPGGPGGRAAAGADADDLTARNPAPQYYSGYEPPRGDVAAGRVDGRAPEVGRPAVDTAAPDGTSGGPPAGGWGPSRAVVEERRAQEPAVRPVATRRARIAITRVDPWSVTKVAFAFSLCLVVVTVIAVGVLYATLDAAGVFASINNAARGLVEGFKVPGAAQVLLVAAIVGLVNVVVLTALSTISAFVYNLTGALTGGFEVTLSERDRPARRID